MSPLLRLSSATVRALAVLLLSLATVATVTTDAFTVPPPHRRHNPLVHVKALKAAAMPPSSLNRQRNQQKLQSSVCLYMSSADSTARKSFFGRFRKPKKIQDIAQPISTGMTLPEVDVAVLLPPVTDNVDGSSTVDIDSSLPTKAMTISEALGIRTGSDVVVESGDEAGRAILVGMPGAFTPTCNAKHFPGYVQQATKLHKAAGVNRIGIVTTNDRYVLNAWKSNFDMEKASRPRGDGGDGVEGKGGGSNDDTSLITMISDGDGELVRSLGLAQDMGFGLGVRSKRFALVVNQSDGKVTHVEVEDEDSEEGGLNCLSKTSAERMLEVLGGSSLDGDINADALLPIVGVAVVLAVLYFTYISPIDNLFPF